jgi:outer membrane receptor protein involved in Fe transport
VTELFSVSAYYKHFDRPIINTLAGPAGSRCESSATNALSATVRGIEFEVRKRLGFLPGTLHNLAVGASVSFIGSTAKLDTTKTSLAEAQLQNQSPYLVNASLSYDAERFSATVLYNVFGDRITEYGAASAPGSPPLPGKVEQSRGTLDAKLRYRLSDGIGLSLAGRNLTDNRVRFTQEVLGNEENAGEYRPGRSIALGVTYGF